MVSQEDIIRMAREVWDIPHNGYIGPSTERLERFATLVAAAEREACAKVCENSVPTYLKDGERWLKGQNGRPDVRLKEIAPNLEAAWEAEQLLKNGSVLESYSVQHQCAAAIRARGQA